MARFREVFSVTFLTAWVALFFLNDIWRITLPYGHGEEFIMAKYEETPTQIMLWSTVYAAMYGCVNVVVLWLWARMTRGLHTAKQQPHGSTHEQ